MIRKIALAAILFILSGPAANAVATCVVSTTGVAFGEISVATKTNLTATGAIVIRCVGSGNFDYVLSLNPGVNGQFTPRQMPLVGSSSINLPYNLYSEASLSSIWGNGFGVTRVVTGRINLGGGSVAIVPLTVYGRVEALTEPTAGDYQDIVIATLLSTAIANVSIPVSVTAHVSKSCSISATNLNFADYNQVQLDGQSQIHLTCTDGTPWNVGLDGGSFPGALTSRRSMSGPGPSQLDYQLYSDPARTVVWGNNVGSDTVPGTANGFPQTLNVYGRIPAGQRVRNGGYVDTITATVTF
jgi:spore coat protein U-like protein